MGIYLFAIVRYGRARLILISIWDTCLEGQNLHVDETMTNNQLTIQKIKLVILFALPFFIFLCIAMHQIDQHSQYANDIERVEKQAQLSIRISALVHELQKERGDSGIYLSSQGSLFSKELNEQREKSDQSFEKLNNFLSHLDRTRYSKSFLRVLDDALLYRNSLEDLRNNIISNRISATEAINYFSTVNCRFLDTIEATAHENPDPELVLDILSYTSFLRGKELVGIERALISATFTQDYFSLNGYQKFIQLVTGQKIYHSEFLRLSTTELKRKFTQITSGSDFEKIHQYRSIAHKNAVSGVFGVQVADWFTVVTSVIDQLKALEDFITGEFKQKALAKRIKSSDLLTKWYCAILFISVLMVLFGTWVMKRIRIAFQHKIDEYRSLFEYSSAGMVVVDPRTGKILFCNASFASSLEFDKNSMALLKLDDLHPDEAKSDMLSIFNGGVTPYNVCKHELLFRRKGGSLMPAEVSVFPIRIEGRQYVAGSIKDITQRRKVMDENSSLLSENRKLLRRNYSLQEIERREIAGELHDQLGQEMVGIMLQADHLNRFSTTGDLQNISSIASNIGSRVRSLIVCTRDLTNKLRPVTLDRLGLESALSELIEDWSKLNYETKFNFKLHNKLPDLNDQISICVFRVVQENLTNIGKYAKASDVSIALRYDEGVEFDGPALTLEIKDDGVGIQNNDQKHGMGIAGMRERIQSLGGTFHLINKPDQGVKIVAHIPVVAS